MARLFVGNLPYSVRSDENAERGTINELKKIFEDEGITVLDGEGEDGKRLGAFVVLERREGMAPRSKGFGFVDVADEQADEAISKLDGKEIDGRPIKVNRAMPKPQA